jgi:hypothetical protein
MIRKIVVKYSSILYREEDNIPSHSILCSIIFNESLRKKYHLMNIDRFPNKVSNLPKYNHIRANKIK